MTKFRMYFELLTVLFVFITFIYLLLVVGGVI